MSADAAGPTNVPTAFPGKLVRLGRRSIAGAALLGGIGSAVTALIYWLVFFGPHRHGTPPADVIGSAVFCALLLGGIPLILAFFNGQRLIVARDGIKLSSLNHQRSWRIMGYDRSTAEFILGDRFGSGGRVDANPVLPRLAAERSRVVERIEQSVARRARAVRDDLLGLPTLAAVEAELGIVRGVAGPFRAAQRALSAERASSLLDDRSASRAELVAAALVLAAHGTAVDRDRIEAVARDCADARFARLLRSIASGDARAEASFRRAMLDVSPARVLFGTVCALALWAKTLLTVAVFALGSGPHEGVGWGVLLALALGLARQWAAQRGVLARWTGFEAPGFRFWWNPFAFAAAVYAMGKAPAGAIPAVLAPLLLYAAWWLPTALTLRRRTHASEGAATSGVAAEDRTHVRVEPVAAEGRSDVHELEAVDGERAGRRGSGDG